MTVKASLERNPIAVLIMVQGIMAGTYLMTKLGLRELSPLALGLWRFALTALVFWVLLASRGLWRLPARADRPALLWLALLAVPLNQGLFLYGRKFPLAAPGALLPAATPILVLCLALRWLQ